MDYKVTQVEIARACLHFANFENATNSIWKNEKVPRKILSPLTVCFEGKENLPIIFIEEYYLPQVNKEQKMDELQTNNVMTTNLKFT